MLVVFEGHGGHERRRFVLPVWWVSFLRSAAVGLQQENLMQLQGEGLHICDGEENPQLSLLFVGQLFLELGREFLKWVLHTAKTLK